MGLTCRGKHKCREVLEWVNEQLWGRLQDRGGNYLSCLMK